MEATIDELITRLRGAESCTEELTLVRSWADAGRIDELLHLGEALLGADSAAARAVLRAVIQGLAARPGAFSVVAALQLAAGASVVEAPEVAAWLAQGQPLENLDTFFADARPDDEVLACLLQELVLTHGDLSAVPEAVAFAEQLHGAHPLGGLPLVLAEFERGPVAEAEFRALPLWPDHGGAEPSAEVTRLAEELPTVDGAGRVDSGVFRLSAPWQPDLLTALPLDCLAGAQTVRVRQLDPAAAFAELFTELAEGLARPYARLTARRVLAALGGEAALDGAPVRWWQFQAPGPWFYEAGRDLGLLAVRQDDELAVLATTSPQTASS
ncbi:hypothetical protein JOF53_005690 [Crossiella equi]|uniref:Uncharacterized protein n=1 Tax=Crossiella equi TaxID=130796 RepID=A0ABS5AJS7_9PSEU|nr:DUF6183 family protein [Crossiella equi]MBP2476818.1 hypothetical protein [Crossiella equi]